MEDYDDRGRPGRRPRFQEDRRGWGEDYGRAAENGNDRVAGGPARGAYRPDPTRPARDFTGETPRAQYEAGDCGRSYRGGYDRGEPEGRYAGRNQQFGHHAGYAPHEVRGGSGGPEDDRGWVERAGAAVASWFGGEADRWGGAPAANHRGRGPKNYVRSDARILEDVNDRLYDDPLLDASDLEVAVAGGEVTLTGHVASRIDKRRAEDLADDVSGVKHVQNNLRIRERGGVHDYGDRYGPGATTIARGEDGGVVSTAGSDRALGSPSTGGNGDRES
ncbi:MAG TPA: BON domain-containing protein [Alphaproteobacteria bacterium]|nr:BON domain-containing protein [Alphaproteobacteria bacterium]